MNNNKVSLFVRSLDGQVSRRFDTHEEAMSFIRHPSNLKRWYKIITIDERKVK